MKSINRNRFWPWLSFLLISCLGCQAGNLEVRVYNLVSQQVVNRKVTLTLANPGPVAIGPWALVGDSVTQRTGTNGVVTFTNVLSGNYRLDIVGYPTRTYLFGMPSTNGTVVFPTVNGATNVSPVYYTSEQIDTLLAGLPSGTNAATTSQTNWPASSITNKIPLSQIDMSLGDSGVTNAIAGWVPWWTNAGVVYSIPVVTNVIPFVTVTDSDVDTFVARAGVSDPTEFAAVSNLVDDLKTSGVWTNLVAFYPFVGSSSNSTAQNLVSASYGIRWIGTVAFNSNGVTGNALDGSGDTGIFVSSLSNSLDSIHGLVHVSASAVEFEGSSTLWGFDLGVLGFSAALSCYFDGSGEIFLHAEVQTEEVSVTIPVAAESGPIFCQNAFDTWSIVTPNGTNTETAVFGGGFVDATPIHLLSSAISDVPPNYAPAYHSPGTLHAASFGYALTDAQRVALVTAVEEFTSALGR
jgi:hypothetical protein